MKQNRTSKTKMQRPDLIKVTGLLIETEIVLLTLAKSQLPLRNGKVVRCTNGNLYRVLADHGASSATMYSLQRIGVGGLDRTLKREQKQTYVDITTKVYQGRYHISVTQDVMAWLCNAHAGAKMLRLPNRLDFLVQGAPYLDKQRRWNILLRIIDSRRVAATGGLAGQ